MEHQKILLVKPAEQYPVRKGIYNRFWTPVCLANCAALLEEKGFEVRIIDAHANQWPAPEVVKRANGFDKIFVISTELDRWECPGTDIEPFLTTSRELSKINENVFVMGIHGTLNPEDILRKTNAKALIRGEPELTVLDICTKKSTNSLKGIKGITYFSGKKLVSNKAREPLDLKILPTPAYHLLDMKKYYYEVLGGNFALFEGARGCPYQCRFCLKEMFGDRVRKKTSEQIIKELDTAITKYGIKNAEFIDLEFTLSRDVYDKVFDHLIEKKYNFRWCCQARADNLDEALLRKMKKAGCKMILCGIETGCEKTMKDIRKGMSLEKVKNGVALAKKVGIDTTCFFMFGFPGETKEDMQTTINFAKKINPTYVSFHDLIPFKTTGMYEHRDSLDNKTLAQKMRRSGYIQFYLRLSFMFSRLLRGDIKNLFSQIKLFWGFIK